MQTVVERTGMACRHECPMCEAILPDDAIAYTRWRMIEDEAGRLGHERTVSMACPCCGHTASRSERRFRD